MGARGNIWCRVALTRLGGRSTLYYDTARQAAADDFGHIVHRLPTAVLKPGSIQDIVKLVQFANRHGVKVSIRGHGYAMFGQTQVEAPPCGTLRSGA